jgi:putative endonuclease
MSFYIYILASDRNGTLYVGVTNDLIRRVGEHKRAEIAGFTKRYGVKKLVYFESCDNAAGAIQREKHIKKWYRRWKIELIETHNPDWHDLAPGLIA